MQKVITINLNGNAYQIDESGYAALVAYAVAWPLHFARRRAAYYSLGGGCTTTWSRRGTASCRWDSGILAEWIAYRYIPEVQEIIRSLPDVWNSFRWADP
jgi:hypothetical protein